MTSTGPGHADGGQGQLHGHRRAPIFLAADRYLAAVATGGRPDSPDAGTVLRAVFWHSIALAILVGFLVYAQANFYPFTQMVVK